jgi:cold shock CspA family protein
MVLFCRMMVDQSCSFIFRAVERAGMDDLKEGQRISFEVFTDQGAARSSAAVNLSDA